MPKNILVPTISDRNNKFVTVYSATQTGSFSELDKLWLGKDLDLIPSELRADGYYKAGYIAAGAVHLLLVQQGLPFLWLKNQRLNMFGRCEGSSIELGFALALLLHDKTYAGRIVATGCLGFNNDTISVDPVSKVPKKLALVLNEYNEGKLDRGDIVIAPKFYTDNNGHKQSVEELAIMVTLTELGINVIPIETLADVLSIPYLFTQHAPTQQEGSVMQKIIINHIKGSKTTQTEEIEVKEAEYLIGRGDNCRILFNAEQDDLVSREHCKIEVKNSNQFSLIDSSRNGTYLNDNKITESKALNPGDTVQLGKDGPQFVFDLDPRPIQPKQTRIAEADRADKATRSLDAQTRQTVEQMTAASRNLQAQTITIKHLQGFKANQSQSFKTAASDDLVFGREQSCQIVFDHEKEDIVSRKHCTITLQDNNQFILADKSINGTYLNNHKITTPTGINTGDKIQLGKNGPLFLFSIDPKGKPTNAEAVDDKKTVFEPTRGIGKHTAEHLIKQSERSTRKLISTITALVLGAIALIGAFMVYQNYQIPPPPPIPPVVSDQSNQPLSAAVIFKQYGNSTVLIEASWKLIHTGSGKQLFQKKDCFMKDGKCITEAMPWYIQRNGVVEPYLDDTGIAIGKSLSGSGFVVHEDGYILTNRHVAANWHAQSYRFQFPGILVQCDDAACNKPAYKVMDEKSPQEYLDSLNQWIPSKTKMLGQSPISGKIIEGRNDYLDITFPDSEHRIPGHLVGTSETADVAMIKIDVPRKLQPVQLSKGNQVAPGESITVMGFPGISPEVVAKIKSHDPIGGEGAIHTVPQATVTTGNIGKILNDAKPTSDNISDVYSSMGNVYQLTVNATGSGNSGGPVFNDKGHVIGLFTYSKSDQNGTQITFAVPIKYGLDLIDVQTKY